MKTRLSYFLLLLLLIACNEKNTFVENDYMELDDSSKTKVSLADYHGDKSIAEQLVIKGCEDNLLMPANADLLYYRIYVNEDGEIEKTLSLQDNEILTDLEKTNIDIISKWKFVPLTINNEDIKYKLDFTFLSDTSKISLISKIVMSTEETANDTTFTNKVETFPEIIGGFNQLSSLIKYPETAKNSGLQGRVFLKIFIDESGNVEKVMIKKGIGSGCDLAAADAIVKTKFTPGTIEGRPVKVQVFIPILFRLADK